MENLTVLVPFYNEENTIYESVTKLISSLKLEKIILINDNSNDNSEKIALELTSKYDFIEYISSKENLGKGSAVALGLKNSNSDFIIVHDADLEYNPTDIINLINAIPDTQKEKVVILGSRFIGNIKRENIYFRTYLANKLFSYLFSIFKKFKVTDVATCYKLISKDIYKNINIEKNGFDFEIEILSKALKKCTFYAEIPINYKGRSYEEGKKIKLSDGFRYLKAILFEYR